MKDNKNTEKKKDITDIIGYIAIAVIVISLAFIVFRITGFTTDTDTATVNVTISDLVSINFTVDFIDFGDGAVDGGTGGARLYTNGTVIDGTWSFSPTYLVLENIGNVNATINLSSSKDADSFIGGTSPEFKIIVSNKSGEESACIGGSAGTYTEIGTSNITICAPLQSNSTVDEIDINVQLFIPNDAVSGARTTTLTAVAFS